MDLRNPSIKDCGNGHYEIYSSVPEKSVDLDIEEQDKKIDFNYKIKACIQQAHEGIGKIEYDTLDRLLDDLLEFIKSDDWLRLQYENKLVEMIVLSLTNKNITAERRDILCKIWATGVRKLFENNTFVADINWIPILLKQLDVELSQETSKLIRGIILDSIVAQSDNGQIQKIADFSRVYLETNSNLANSVFITIMRLAENEMNHKKFNEECLKSKFGNGEDEFVQDKKKYAIGGDCDFKEDNAKQEYESNREKIIQDYLLDEVPVDLPELNLNNYDIRMLCATSNCGLSLDNNSLYIVIRKIILSMIDIDAQADCDNDIAHIIGSFAKYDVIRLFQREIGKNKENCEKVYEILFDGIDFSKFKSDIVEFYLEIFSIFVSYYFDAYKMKKYRTDLEEKIKVLEKRINAIDNSYVKTELTQAVALLDSKFYADWSKCVTSYSEKDKKFLNQQYEKYGHYHLEHFIYTLYQMHLKELLPEILLSVEKVFANSISENGDKFSSVISKQRWIVDKLILDAYFYNSDEIKEDEELSNAYIHILEIMIELNNEKAAVLLDEFLIH